uniref:FZ domain-containing protein n=1 Tax=Mesocestoides corti TaxID=53468 RepID=A0A5K3FEP3_MESCO
MKAVPMCWDKLHIFLCMVYVPECQEQRPAAPNAQATTTHSRIVLPEREMCLAVLKACPLLFSGEEGVGGRGLLGDTIPRFFQCQNYASVCRQNKLRPKIFDVNKAQCQAPLVSTTNRRNWIKGVETCAFPCHSPIYRPEHYALARNLLFVAAVAGIVVNVCVLCSLRLLRTSSSSSRCLAKSSAASATATDEVACVVDPARQLPHTALTFIHLAFLVGCVGLLSPQLPGIGNTIACRADGSVRVGEPQTQYVECCCFNVPVRAVSAISNLRTKRDTTP